MEWNARCAKRGRLKRHAARTNCDCSPSPTEMTSPLKEGGEGAGELVIADDNDGDDEKKKKLQ